MLNFLIEVRIHQLSFSSEPPPHRQELFLWKGGSHPEHNPADRLVLHGPKEVGPEAVIHSKSPMETKFSLERARRIELPTPDW
jgi:hypothetical protein